MICMWKRYYCDRRYLYCATNPLPWPRIFDVTAGLEPIKTGSRGSALSAEGGRRSHTGSGNLTVVSGGTDDLSPSSSLNRQIGSHTEDATSPLPEGTAGPC